MTETIKGGTMVSLILEGGGSRGIYTAGVLKALFPLYNRIDAVFGTSMGACNGVSFISKQVDRNRRVIVDYINDRRYFNFQNLLFKNKSVFNMDFLFGDIPYELDPFDFQAFQKSSIDFYATTTHVKTGEPKYFSRKDVNSHDDLNRIVKASSSLPALAVPVEINGEYYLDGGLSDSVPIKKAITEGYDQHIIVLTRDIDYKKTPLKFNSIYRYFLSEADGAYQALKNRHQKYNKTLDFIKSLEKKGEVFVIRPREAINIGKFERNVEKFESIFNLGYEDTVQQFNDLKSYLGRNSVIK